MKTIKLPYTSDKNLLEIFKQYSNVVRYSYNRFLDGKSEKDIRLLSKSLNNVNLLNSWLIQCAILDAKGLHKKFQNKKIIFGGKLNFINRLKNKITKDDDRRYNELNEVQKRRGNPIDNGIFDPEGARYPVRGGDTPVGVPNDMKTYTKK